MGKNYKNGKKNWSKGKGSNYKKNVEGGCRGGRNSSTTTRDSVGNTADTSVVVRNDMSWYNKNPELLQAAGNFPFSYALGTTAPAWGGIDNYSEATDGEAIPGIMAFDVITGPGYTTGRDVEAVNVVGRKLYSWDRRANSGSTNYEAPDTLLYLLAADELYCWYVSGLRAYNTMNAYSYTNRYEPKVLIEAMGFDYDDLQDNQAQFRYALEHFRSQMSGFVIPNGFDYFKRHVYLFGNYFYDEESRKRQYFIFRNVGYRTYEAKTSETGGMLKFHRSPRKMTVQQWTDIAKTLINKLNNDDDIHTIAGDFLKACDKSSTSIVTWAPVSMDAPLKPINDPGIMSQIAHTTIPYSVLTNMDILYEEGTDARIFSVFNITQANSNMVSAFNIPVKVAGANAISPLSIYGVRDSVLVNLDADFPTPEQVVYALRNTALWDSHTINGEIYIYPRAYGSEFCIGATVYTIVKDSNDQNTVVSHPFSTVMPIRNAQDIHNFCSSMAFDHHPYVSAVEMEIRSSEVNESIVEFVQSMGHRAGSNIPWDNYSVITTEQCARMHDLCLMSLFTAPFMGIFG